jgi:hypothetical protein
MMTCAELDARLPRYLDGTLEPEACEALEIHAGDCERCAPILEERTRRSVPLAFELAPGASHREAVLARVARSPHSVRSRRWAIPMAIAAGLLVVFGLTRPPVKSGQAPPAAGSPAAIAAERADGQFQQLDAARAELREALRSSPGDPGLQQALDRLDAQRRSLENLVQEFES